MIIASTMRVTVGDMANELKQAEKQIHQAQSDLDKAIQLIEEETRQEQVAGGQPVLGPDGQALAEPEAKAAEPEALPPKQPGSARGIETLFKSSYRVQMDLTSLADNKANMMISINGIIMSIILASVAPKLDSNPWLLLPTLLLLVGSLISMIFAILAARPRVSRAPITLSDLKNSQGNILFFGNFANMSERDFVIGLEELMQDRQLTYDTMIRNLHSLGSVLNKKFALLQIAYTSFMIALSLGVTSFLVVFIWLSMRSP
ncbi:MAG TPA: Pycsar system effector family protein [Xanthomonadales bacterium]|nr:Pycsar system effector family protein [Xanthomonadales bacterium]